PDNSKVNRSHADTLNFNHHLRTALAVRSVVRGTDPTPIQQCFSNRPDAQGCPQRESTRTDVHSYRQLDCQSLAATAGADAPGSRSPAASLSGQTLLGAQRPDRPELLSLRRRRILPA